MIRVGWPTAARAVPRLMAVVVLPTPPFWLATTRTRGRFPAGPATLTGSNGTDMALLPNFKDRSGGIGLAGVPDDGHPPRFMGFGQFNPNRLSLEEQVHGLRTLKLLCIAQELAERRAGPGRDHIERLGRGVFHAGVADLRLNLHPRGGGFEEGTFLGRGFDRARCESPARSRSRQASTRPGKPAPLPRSTRLIASAGISGSQLRRVPDMTMPDLGQRDCARPDCAAHSTPPAAPHRPSAAPVFHVKQRSPSRTPPGRTSMRCPARLARLALGGALADWASTRVSAAGVTPSMRAAWPSVAGRIAASFWRRLGGEPMDRAIVQVVRQTHAFVPAEGQNVGVLAVEIAGILGVDLRAARWRRPDTPPARARSPAGFRTRPRAG